jgi:hypothetical protein
MKEIDGRRMYEFSDLAVINFNATNARMKIRIFVDSRRLRFYKLKFLINQTALSYKTEAAIKTKVQGSDTTKTPLLPKLVT